MGNLHHDVSNTRPAVAIWKCHQMPPKPALLPRTLKKLPVGFIGYMCVGICANSMIVPPYLQMMSANCHTSATMSLQRPAGSIPLVSQRNLCSKHPRENPDGNKLVCSASWTVE